MHQLVSMRLFLDAIGRARTHLHTLRSIEKQSQALVYGMTFDGLLRTAVNNSKSPDEVMTYGGIRERSLMVEEAASKELSLKNPQPTADSRTGDEAGAGSVSIVVEAGATSAATASSSAAGVSRDELRLHATRMVKSDCKLVAEPPTETAMFTLLRTSETVMSWHGQHGTEYIGIVFEPACANESITAPHIRVAPFQKNQYGRLAIGTLKARAGSTDDGDPMCVATGDCWLTLAGDKHGNHPITYNVATDNHCSSAMIECNIVQQSTCTTVRDCLN